MPGNISSNNITIDNGQLLYALGLINAEVSKFKKDRKDPKPEYSVTTSFDKATAEHIRESVAKILWAGAIPSDFPKSLGIHSGDEREEGLGDDGEYKYGDHLRNRFFLRASTQFKPLVWFGPEKRTPVPNELYSGLIGRVVVAPKAYDFQGRKGISFYLQAAWITGRGTRLQLGSGNPAADLESAGEIQFAGDWDSHPAEADLLG